MRLSTTTVLYCVLLYLMSGCGPRVSAPEYSLETPSEPPPQVWSPRQARTAADSTASPSTYTVKRGDTLYSIAWQQGLEVRQLADLNGLRYPYTIYGGQQLVVRPAGPVSGAPLAQRGAVVTRPLTPAQAAAEPSPAKADPVPQQTAPPEKKPVKAGPAPQQTAAARQAAVPAQTTGSLEYDGKWVWPTQGKLVRGYQQDSAGKKGISIGGDAGQPVKAAAAGKVVYVGSGLVGYGRLIIIKHNERLLSAYGHNSQLLVEEGDQVRAGQIIAKMGSSGAARTALYFEIRKDGKPVDPLKYLPRT